MIGLRFKYCGFLVQAIGLQQIMFDLARGDRPRLPLVTSLECRRVYPRVSRVVAVTDPRFELQLARQRA